MQIVVTRDGATVVQFTRTLDDTFTGLGPQNLLIASGPQQALAQHTDREGFTLELTENGMAAVAALTTLDKLRRAHAWLMAIGWGTLIPLGVISAASCRSWGPAWCVLPPRAPLLPCSAGLFLAPCFVLLGHSGQPVGGEGSA